MSAIHDGPCSPHFKPLSFKGNAELSTLAATNTMAASLGLSGETCAALEHAPRGTCVSWGIPFEIGEVVILSDRPVSIEVSPFWPQQWRTAIQRGEKDAPAGPELANLA